MAPWRRYLCGHLRSDSGLSRNRSHPEISAARPAKDYAGLSGARTETLLASEDILPGCGFWHPQVFALAAEGRSDVG